MSVVSMNLLLNNGTILYVWKIWVSKLVKQPERSSDRQPASLPQVNLQSKPFYLKLLEHSYVFIPSFHKYLLSPTVGRGSRDSTTNQIISALKKKLSD